MDFERSIQETVARCVSIMVSYHNCGPNEDATEEMITDIRAVADASVIFSLALEQTVETILRPVEAELVARYGHELGSRLNSRFLMAYAGHSVPARQPNGRRLETARRGGPHRQVGRVIRKPR
jgi:hypothetical protein